MRDSTVLPDLRMFPTAALVPHEDCDPRRIERLSQRVLKEGRLKNPPVVAAIPETERFVVLDGANRSAAFAAVGIPHIVAQVVSYGDPGVVLDTWYHVVSGMPLKAFEAALAEVDGMQLRPCSLEQARADWQPIRQWRTSSASRGCAKCVCRRVARCGICAC